jgi:hypothetical protein
MQRLTEILICRYLAMPTANQAIEAQVYDLKGKAVDKPFQ